MGGSKAQKWWVTIATAKRIGDVAEKVETTGSPGLGLSR